ncbi:hypothetical protein [Actinoplanes sp. NPDC026619]|uniref:hypothetical protein n=1 Tax=Actinoplanes sp. NPDC026619 TaxID=3155798 RepID=UPI0034041852
MPTFDHIYVATEADPEDVAEQIAEATGMSLEVASVDPILTRAAESGLVTCVLRENFLGDPDASGPDRTLLDSYSLMLQIHQKGADLATQFGQAEEIFTEMSRRIAAPLALTRGNGVLVGVSLGVSEPTWMPDGTSPSAVSRPRWEAFDPASRTTDDL